MKDLNMEELLITTDDNNVQKFTSKSKLFQYLYTTEKYSVSEISKLTSSHYSFVYEVIQQNCDYIKSEKYTVSDDIRRLYKEGLTVGNIAKNLNRNYSFVFSVVKKYKQQMINEEVLDVDEEVGK